MLRYYLWYDATVLKIKHSSFIQKILNRNNNVTFSITRALLLCLFQHCAKNVLRYQADENPFKSKYNSRKFLTETGC